ncbi:hypothetical protein A2572_03175 [Candidatus Collierbacteria bacterium RIFOXYD1_FULL_40_9]|uniref:PPM-type phosphatase domain-containing protein n=1 Tax=Candidatus Collierbacteria bacterium RIFOXYD1_FULL_40_9 TaxID=1817731 RepID=A0A1F5FWW4_9BACT|nr:MAG: hypothetical protein A2572_03175 [Candidatus Collierbacteria bacterium RIFOXYD1_FULL_40_9]
MPNFDLKTGKVIGYDHLQAGKNCQDAIASKQFELGDGQYSIVVIADGSSVAKSNPHLVHSEVGSQLTVDFLLRRTYQYLSENYHAPIIPRFLFDDLIQYYQSILVNQSFFSVQEKVEFVNFNLLCTVLALIVTPKYGLILRYGDGIIIIDNQVFTFDYEDMPPYPGYLLIPQHLKINPSQLSQGFEVTEFDPNNTQKIAIGSDAFVANQELIPLFWNHHHPNQIQRNLNVWSKVDHKLLDDASLAVLEKKGE